MNPYYADDHVTLYHGDCLEVTEWLAADVLVTDPPYGRGWRQGYLAGHTESQARDGIANDHDTSTRDTALSLWNGVGVVFGDLMLSPPDHTKLVAVYHKDAGMDGMRGAMGGVRRDAEAIYLIGPWPTGLGGRSSVFTTRAMVSGSSGLVARHGGHPHTKAGNVMQELIQLCPPGSIADPFAGSGSTLVAAKALGRKAIGVELEERYCEIAARRLSQDVLDFSQNPVMIDPA
jgi:site-specific DNA-methyltransferase (adenine-specific)